MPFACQGEVRIREDRVPIIQLPQCLPFFLHILRRHQKIVLRLWLETEYRHDASLIHDGEELAQIVHTDRCRG